MTLTGFPRCWLGGLLLVATAGCAEVGTTVDDVHELGRLLLLRNQPQAALAEYQKVLLVRPEDPMVHYDLGLTHTRLGELEKALESYTAAIELNREYSQALVNRSQVFNRMGRHPEAARDALAAIAIEGSDSLAWLALAVAHRGLGQIDLAEAEAMAALALDDRDPQARLLAAQIRLDRQLPKDAVNELTSILGRLDEEQAVFRHAVDRPEVAELRAEALATRSAAYTALGETRLAREDFESAQMLDPEISLPKSILAARPGPSLDSASVVLDRAVAIAEEYLKGKVRNLARSKDNSGELLAVDDSGPLRIIVRVVPENERSLSLTGEELRRMSEGQIRLQLVVVAGIQFTPGAQPVAAGGQVVGYRPDWRSELPSLKPLLLEYSLP